MNKTISFIMSFILGFIVVFEVYQASIASSPANLYSLSFIGVTCSAIYFIGNTIRLNKLASTEN